MRSACSFIFLILLIVDGHARRVEVGSDKNLHRIIEGIHQADDGDTVLVFPGVYQEGNIIIDKAITLTGIDWPVLDGEYKVEVISIKHDSVVVSGFKIINSGVASTIDYAGLKIYDSNYVSILNNEFENCFFGIYTQYGKHCIISGNNLHASATEEQNCGNGVHCWYCDSMQIINNEIRGHRDGVYFEFVTNSIIWRNRSIGNVRYGLHFMFSSHDTYVANVFTNNGAGVAVMFSHHVGMFSNYFFENWGDAAYGILLKEISDSHVQGNHFDRNTTGIFMEGASRVLMTRNSFDDNGWALKIQASCMDIVLQYNDFTSNSFDVGTNGSLVLNTFMNNYWDKYEGYDLNRNGIGDVPYRPVSLYSMIVEKNPPAMMLFRSFITVVLDKTEKVMPSLIPENLVDNEPRMKSNGV